MMPKKKLIDKCMKDGAMERCQYLMCAAHLLQCVASNLYGEADDIFRKYGLQMGEMKEKHSHMVKAADVYFLKFSELVVTEAEKMNMFRDIEAYEKGFREWAMIPAGWKPNKEGGEHDKENQCEE